MKYRFDITAYHEFSGEWRQRVRIDNAVQHLIKYDAGIPKTVELPVPPVTYMHDGEIVVRVSKLRGAFAMVHKGNLYEFEEEQVGGPQTAMTMPINPIFGIKVLPNIFKHNALVQYAVPQRQQIRLELYDILGRKIMTLADRIAEPGVYTYTIDASNLSAGIYFLMLKGEKETRTQKVLVVR